MGTLDEKKFLVGIIRGRVNIEHPSGMSTKASGSSAVLLSV